MSGYYRVDLQKGYVNQPSQHPSLCDSSEGLIDYASTLEGPLAADLFCGAGGLSLGLDRAGIRTVIGVDHDDYALDTFRSLFGGLSLKADLSADSVIEEISDTMLKAGITVIAGGPPCQPFSRAGRATIRNLVRQGIRDPHDHRRDLWQSFLEIVSRVQPLAVIIENVPDMALADEGLILRLIVADLESQGYSVEARLIDAWRYGVPQHRQRLIVVALAEGKQFSWPEEVETHPTVDDAISDLPPLEGGWAEAGPAGWHQYEGPRTPLQVWARRGVEASDEGRIYDHVTRSVREDDREIFASMDHETRYSDIDPELRRYRDDIFDDKYKRLSGSDLSRTIIAHIAKDGYGFIHPHQHRTISIREAARLQTFPDRVRFAGPPTAQLRQIGNAVPPLLGEAIGRAVVASLGESSRRPLSTTEVSETLATWYRDNGALGLPWLEGESEWAIRLGGALLRSGDPPYLVNPIWAVVRTITRAHDVVEQRDDLRRLAAQPSRREDLERVIVAAQSASSGAPYKEDAAWRLAHLASQSSDRNILYTSGGVLRVVARTTGTNVDRENQGSDGRILAARMVGVEPLAREANLALLVIAQNVCLPVGPRCGECPLEPECAYAAEAHLQMPLVLGG